jgi:two-component system, LytTR family, response regulator
MTFINAIIIDDEPDSIELLKIQLARHCPQIDRIRSYTSSVKALEDIRVQPPDLLFLDIEMPGMNGFELLEQLMPVQFGVIFITAYNQFALRAFRFNALDYLVKPIDTEELLGAVAKAERNVKPSQAQLNQLLKQMRGEPVGKIAIPTQNGITFIDLNEIVYAEASNNYTRLILMDESVFTISKTLKDVQEVLEESHFLRIHRQYIINLNHVKQFNRNDCLLVMNNKAELPVARNQKERLVERYGWL